MPRANLPPGYWNSISVLSSLLTKLEKFFGLACNLTASYLCLSAHKSFQGLPLDDALAAKNAPPRCGVGVIDLRSGDLVHILRIAGVIEQLQHCSDSRDRHPVAIGFCNDEIRRVISMDDPGG